MDSDNRLAGPLQLIVLEYLWQHGESTVHSVHDAINQRPGAVPRAYTTVLTVMRNLRAANLCTQAPLPGQTRTHVFAPTITREEYRKRAALALVRDHFAGDHKAAIAAVAAVR